jgi:hypothetical protein
VEKSTIIAAARNYMDAWNERDETARLTLLARCWSDRGRYVDPNIDLEGRAALAQHIAKVQASRPGARLEFMSAIDVHHNVVRFLWRLMRADGSVGDTSIDFGEVDENGFLVRIVGFFGPAPEIEKSQDR